MICDVKDRTARECEFSIYDGTLLQAITTSIVTRLTITFSHLSGRTFGRKGLEAMSHLLYSGAAGGGE
jgi:hypothetical protein